MKRCSKCSSTDIDFIGCIHTFYGGIIKNEKPLYNIQLFSEIEAEMFTCAKCGFSSRLKNITPFKKLHITKSKRGIIGVCSVYIEGKYIDNTLYLEGNIPTGSIIICHNMDSNITENDIIMRVLTLNPYIAKT